MDYLKHLTQYQENCCSLGLHTPKFIMEFQLLLLQDVAVIWDILWRNKQAQIQYGMCHF